jgi:hypothetical protein
VWTTRSRPPYAAGAATCRIVPGCPVTTRGCAFAGRAAVTPLNGSLELTFDCCRAAAHPERPPRPPSRLLPSAPRGLVPRFQREARPSSGQSKCRSVPPGTLRRPRRPPASSIARSERQRVRSGSSRVAYSAAPATHRIVEATCGSAATDVAMMHQVARAGCGSSRDDRPYGHTGRAIRPRDMEGICVAMTLPDAHPDGVRATLPILS